MRITTGPLMTNYDLETYRALLNVGDEDGADRVIERVRRPPPTTDIDVPWLAIAMFLAALLWFVTR